MKLHRRRRATVTEITEDLGDVLLIDVLLDDQVVAAACFPSLTGRVERGDDVLVNTVAGELRLGSGGVHFVMANLSAAEQSETESSGHIIKLRYTPVQINVLAIEEEASPHRNAVMSSHSLEGMPVVVAMLHSMVAPIAAGIKAEVGQRARIIYVMTDTAALCMGLSRLVRSLVSEGLIDATMSTGQAFGGDYESINVYSGLLAARAALKADVAIVAPGVGHAGTGTPFGFSGIEQASILDAVNALSGTSIASLRVSFADPRDRHIGVSHQSLTVLGHLTWSRVTVPVPDLSEDQMTIVRKQLERSHIEEKHDVIRADGEPAIEELERRKLHVTTMGRDLSSDRPYFLAAGAAGMAAATLLR